MELRMDRLSRVVYLIGGPVGAGKTTVSRRLAERLPLAAHIETDRIQDLIVSGGFHPQEEPKSEAERQLSLRRRNVALLADSFFESGVTPIIDEAIVYAAALKGYIELIGSRPLALVLLAPSLEVSLARDAARTEKQVGYIWRHLDAVMRKELLKTGLWVDNSHITVDQTVDLVLENVLTRGVLADN